MYTYKASMYGHGGSDRGVTITGADEVQAIKQWFRINAPTTKLISITEQDGDYVVNHEGRENEGRWLGDRNEIKIVTVDRFRSFRVIKNLL